MKFIGFNYPIALVLLTGIVPLWIWHIRSKADLPLTRKKLVFFIRLIIYILVVLAIAGLRLYLPTDRMCVTFLIDESESTPDGHLQYAMDFIQKSIKSSRYDDTINIVLFGDDVYLDQTLEGKQRIDEPSTLIKKERTNIAQAINFAQAISTQDTIKRIILFSDGNENVGNAEEEGVLAGIQNTEIWSVPYPDEQRQEVMIKSIHVPEKVNHGEPFDLKIVIESSVKTDVNMKIFLNGSPVALDRVTAYQGENVYFIPQVADKAGTYSYEVNIEANQDRTIKNNRATAVTFIRGRPKVLYLGEYDSVPGPVAAYIKDAGIEVCSGNPGNMPNNLAALKNYESIIFSNLSALSISARQMQMIKNFVQDLGGGFIMIGGMNSYGIGGYYNTPIEDILPVDMDVRKKKKMPQAAIMLLIDKSGSMSEMQGKKEKIVLARESAIITLEVLNEQDIVGVITFDSAAKWVVTPQTLKNKKKLIDEIASIRAGGGTNLYPALDSAIDELSKVKSAIKHIIVLSDGRTERGNFNSLVERAKKAKITITTVSVGRDADFSFMQDLARKGKGRSYYTDDATLLPKIFVKDTFIAAQSTVIEEAFIPKIDELPNALSGIDLREVPQLTGYCMTAEKSLATVSLISHKKDPILALWRTGLGKSVAFTSDEGEKWAKQWYRWKEAGAFWQQLTRWTLPSIERGDYEITTEIDQDICTIQVEAVDEKGNYLNFLQFTGRVISPELESFEVSFQQVGPGRYRGEFRGRTTGDYIVNLREAGGGGRLFAISIPYSLEYKTYKTNTYLLNKLAQSSGGKYKPDPCEIFMHPSPKAYTPRDTWEKLLLLAMLLFPVDIALRRVFLPAGWYNRILKRKTVRPIDGVEVQATLTALKTKKKEIEFQYSEKVPAESRDRQVEKPFAQKSLGSLVTVLGESPKPATGKEAESPLKPEIKPSLSLDSISYLERLKQAKKRARGKK